jgi:hypothetical protein
MPPRPRVPDIETRVRQNRRDIDMLLRRAYPEVILNTTKVKIDASSSGDTLVVAAVTGKKIRVIAYDFLVSANVDVYWKSNTTSITGVYSVPVRGGKVNPENESGWMDTATGEALYINLSTAVTLGGSLTYIEV